MSVERVWVWTCDVCGAIWRNSNGRPTGWTWLASRDGLIHRCDKCEAKAEPEHAGIPLGRVA